ncbi:MAG: DNA polymerase I [Clostridia bacterium]|nr:DNA polymerase I [Clostridia bacterium]
MAKLLAVDGNSILNRQFYGIRPLTNSAGVYTQAVYGFLNVLFSQLDNLKPDYVAVAFDLKAPTFRHKFYPEYKAGRHAMPSELAMQFPYAKKCISALGIKVIELEGYEADDILGTLSRMAEEISAEAYLLTGDRDSYQLISDKTTVLYASNSGPVPFTEKEFTEKYTIKPSQFVDLKALMGDSSDNIPGVPGIGEKTAIKLISCCETLDKLYEDISASGVSAKIQEKLTLGKESAYTSKKLAQIERNAPLGLTLDDIIPAPKDVLALKNLFAELEFSAFAKRIFEESEALSEKREFASISALELITLPYENPTSVIIDESTLFVKISDKAYSCEFSEVSQILPFFEDENRSFIVYDIKELLHTLYPSNEEIPVKVRCDFDVLLAAYVLSPSDGSYDISRLSNAYLGKILESDVDALAPLANEMKKKLEESDMLGLYEDIEVPLALVLFEMERRGFALDIQSLKDFSVALDDAVHSLSQMIYESVGHEFNINSPKQLGVALFDELSLPTFKKTQGGYSTNAEVLEKLRPYHPIIDMILNYRQVAKLKSTYADGLLKVVDDDGRVRTKFRQTVAATGRLSSIEPNLQNIPVRTELGREMRRCFVAREGYTLVDADYSQIELRLLAAISGDENMCEAFRREIDIHTVTASQVFNVPEEEVTSELRKRAKAVNFGIVYGIGDFSLANDIGVSKKEAGEYIKNYKATYKGVADYLDKTIESAYADGYVVTMFGRRRYIPELASPKAMMKKFGERVAMNSPIQGSAADIIKLAMINVEKALCESGLDAKLILQIHDELIVEAAEKDAEQVKEILVSEMENAVKLSVPLSVEASIGKSWFECK